MKVKIKKLKDLERKITISADIEDYKTKFSLKIKFIIWKLPLN